MRNSQKAIQTGCCYIKDVAINDIVDLSKQLIIHLPGINEFDYRQFTTLFEMLKAEGKAITRGVKTADNKLMASAVFLFSHQRVYYILVGNHPNGKTMGASHFLIENFIREFAGRSLTLDFEGSDIRNLAFFYSGFGSQQEHYPAIRWNRLPWWISWMKD